MARKVRDRRIQDLDKAFPELPIGVLQGFDCRLKRSTQDMPEIGLPLSRSLVSCEVVRWAWVQSAVPARARRKRRTLYHAPIRRLATLIARIK